MLFLFSLRVVCYARDSLARSELEDGSAQHCFYFIISECRLVTFVRGNYMQSFGMPRSWERLVRENKGGFFFTDITGIVLHRSRDRPHCSEETAADSDGVTMQSERVAPL
jgi:hypothetical protein